MTQLWGRCESADRTYSLPLHALIHKGPPRTSWVLSAHGVLLRFSVRRFAFGGEEKMNRSSQDGTGSRSCRSISRTWRKTRILNRRSQSGRAVTTTSMRGLTPPYWFRAEDAEERRGSKNLSPTLRYSATSSFAKATARRVCASNLRGIARNRMSVIQGT